MGAEGYLVLVGQYCSCPSLLFLQGEPLQKLMSHYRKAQGFGRCKLAFYFDGQRLAATCTPEELGMESGDVIEVWS